MNLSIRSEWSLKHKSTDLVLTFKICLSGLQFLWSEVGLNVSDLDVGMLLVEAGGIYLRRERDRERERECVWEREREREREKWKVITTVAADSLFLTPLWCELCLDFQTSWSKVFVAWASVLPAWSPWAPCRWTVSHYHLQMAAKKHKH